MFFFKDLHNVTILRRIKFLLFFLVKIIGTRGNKVMIIVLISMIELKKNYIE